MTEQQTAEGGEQTFRVEVSRTISVSVEVCAVDGDAAIDKVSRHDFPLPPRDEWSGHKDWAFRAYDSDGDEVAEQER